MSDALEFERRQANKQLTERVNSIWPWFHGNGNIGAKDRLNTIENVINGKEGCFGMTKIDNHLSWHDKQDNRKWELRVGIALIVASQIVFYILSTGAK